MPVNFKKKKNVGLPFSKPGTVNFNFKELAGASSADEQTKLGFVTSYSALAWP